MIKWYFWAATAIGAACGLAHSAYLYKRIGRQTVPSQREGPGRPEAISYAIWCFLLWVIFGVYVTSLWIVACCFYVPSRLLRRPSTILPDRAAPATKAQAGEVTPEALEHVTAQSSLAAVRRVAIIGAGASGLAAARVLLSQGLECVLFERRGALGGVWEDGYVNFGVQVQRELYEFPDWPLPKDATNFTPGPEFQKYLTGYARHFGILPHILLNCNVTALSEQAAPLAGWDVTYRHQTDEKHEAFDLVVVSIGQYSETPNLPAFDGADQFEGTMMHVSRLKSREELAGKRVVIVGYGKSATDAAIEAAAVALQTHVVLRHAYWPVPRKLLGILPFKWGMLNRLTSTLIPLYLHPTAFELWVHRLGKPLIWFWWRLVEILLRFQCGLGTGFGKRESLVPDEPVEIGSFGEPTMLPKPAFFGLVRKGAIRARKAAIHGFTATEIVLDNGDKIATDMIVLATGWKTDYAFLPKAVKARLQLELDGLYLYRHILHPDVQRLAFIGNASTISSVLTYSLQARWLGNLIAGKVYLPDDIAMRTEIAALKEWKRRWMPSSQQRGARLLLHMLHYHDELVGDLGANTLRKRGFFAPLKELIAPYQPRDYRDVEGR